MNMVIYGAQAIALGAYRSIKELDIDAKVLGFLVTKRGNNASYLEGLQVRELEEFSSGMSQAQKDEIKVLIATPENVMDEIERGLFECGLHNIEKLNSLTWAKMQEEAFSKSDIFVPLSTYVKGTASPDIRVFKMVHHKDKELKTIYDDPSYVTRLQVGAAFADKDVAELKDNDGDNISDRNGNYSELTGIYWVWKNHIQGAKEDGYTGIAHYRRFLNLTDDDLKKLQSNDIDVVLPYPMPYLPNIEEHHKRYLTDEEWNAVLRAVEELYPDMVEGFEAIINQDYMFNYNIIVAKNVILDDYYEWLFNILFKVEEILDPDGTKVPNRYVGYIAETLETIYFMHYKDKFKIAHAGCRFLV